MIPALCRSPHTHNFDGGFRQLIISRVHYSVQDNTSLNRPVIREQSVPNSGLRYNIMYWPGRNVFAFVRFPDVTSVVGTVIALALAVRRPAVFSLKTPGRKCFGTASTTRHNGKKTGTYRSPEAQSAPSSGPKTVPPV